MRAARPPRPGCGGRRGPAPTRPCCSPASLGDVQGPDARAVPPDSGGAGSCRKEVQHAGGRLRALPRRRLRVSWGGSRPLQAGSRPRPAPPGPVGRCCGLVVPIERTEMLCRELSALKAHVSFKTEMFPQAYSIVSLTKCI